MAQQVHADLQESIFTGGPSTTGGPRENLHEWLLADGKPSLSATDKRPALTYSRLLVQLAGTPAQLPARAALVLGPEEAVELAVLLLAVMGLGRAACPLDSRLPPKELRSALRQLGCGAAITTPDGLRVLEGALALDPQLAEQVPVIEVFPHPEAAGTYDWPMQLPEGLLPPPPPHPGGPAAPGAPPVLLLRTSGTTAKPKVVPLSLPNLRHGGLAIARSLELGRQDVCLNAMPYFHIGGIACSLLAPLFAGGQVVIMSGFEASEFATLLCSDPLPTWYYAVPTIHKALLLHLQRAGGLGSKHQLRLARSGAAHIPHADAVALAGALGCQVLPTYSMSECMPVCSTPLGWKLQKKDTVGAPLAVSLRIAKEDGQALGYGERGEVLIQGPGVTAGYEGGAGSDSMVGGWFRTGDTGRLDHDGHVFLEGRKREMVKRGGEQISLHEVDQGVAGHPAVQLCISFAVQNEFWGEEVACAVVLRPGHGAGEADAILRAARERLAEHKAPRQVVVVQESELPKTATGKYIRSGLAERLGVRAADTAAAEALRGPPGGLPPQVSKALSGLRTLTSIWVIQFHVVTWKSNAWRRVQGYSFDVTIFTILSGLLLVSSTNQAIPKEKWREFTAIRCGAMSATYIVSAMLGATSYFMRCPPSRADRCMGNEDTYIFPPYWLFLLVSFGSIPFGYCHFNRNTWYQLVIYALNAYFPWWDRLCRRRSTLGLQLLLTLFTALGTTQFRVIRETHSRFFADSWFYHFIMGIILCHIFQRTSIQERSAGERLFWALQTDCISLGLASIGILSYCSGHGFEGPQKRQLNYACFLLGIDRLGTPFLLLWIYGLALGAGLTSRVLGLYPLVRLSHLAYGVYLNHIAVAWFWYYANFGTELKPWMPMVATTPFVMDFWPHMPAITALSFAVAWLIQEVLPIDRLVPYCIKFQYHVPMFILSFFRVGPGLDTPPSEGGAFGEVQRAVRRLTGAQVERGTALDALGMDSFGAAALLGVLRASRLPAARSLRLADLRRLATAGALADHLAGAGAETGPALEAKKLR